MQTNIKRGRGSCNCPNKFVRHRNLFIRYLGPFIWSKLSNERGSFVPRPLGGPVTFCLAMTSLAFAARPRSLADLSESATNGVHPSSESDVIFGSEKNVPSTFKMKDSFDNG